MDSRRMHAVKISLLREKLIFEHIIDQGYLSTISDSLSFIGGFSNDGLVLYWNELNLWIGLLLIKLGNYHSA
jgi:hypothetical protein